MLCNYYDEENENEEVNNTVEVEATPVEENTNSTSNNSGSKSKLVAGLLQIFLGSFGVGRFYLGYVGIGIAQILVTWLTCGFGAIWPLIDGIMILTGSVKTDANGNPLSD